MNLEQNNEQRRFARKTMKAQLKLTPLSVETSGIKTRQSIPAHTVDISDISAGGARFKMHDSFKNISYMLVEASFGADPLPVYLLGQRRWGSANDTECGISFLTRRRMRHIFSGRDMSNLPREIFEFNDARQLDLDRFLSEQ